MSFPEPTSGYIDDGRFYEVPVVRDPIFIPGPTIAAVPVVPPAQQPTAPVRPSAWPKVLLIAMAVLVVAGLAGLVVVLLRPAGTSGSDLSARQIAACRERVKLQLKAPATARFSEEVVSREPTGPFFIVTGLVDAENGFGALLRQRYRCTADAEGNARAVSLAEWS
jgi:hypothetical protein